MTLIVDNFQLVDIYLNLNMWAKSYEKLFCDEAAVLGIYAWDTMELLGKLKIVLLSRTFFKMA